MDKKVMPVFVHHELNQKNQTGGAKNQRYVKCCVEQAEKYNEKVILFGNKGTEDYAVNWVDVSDFQYDRWTQFLNVFENLSDYPDEWAKGIFKRFFIFEKYMVENCVDECIILDSDVLVWCNYSEKAFTRNCDFALEKKREGCPNESQTAAAGVAFFKLNTLRDFVSFCIKTYREDIERLRKVYDNHKQKGLAGGICEMNLLYWFVKDSEQKYSFKNIGIEEENVIPVIDFPSAGVSCEWKKTYKTSSNPLFIDLIDVNDLSVNSPKVLNIVTNKRVRVEALHFIGKSKMLMEAYADGGKISLGVYIDWVYWIIRGKAAKVWHSLRK